MSWGAAASGPCLRRGDVLDRGLRLLLLLRLGRCRLGARRILPLARDGRDHGAYLHIVAAFGVQYLRVYALVYRLELHCRLIGLYLGEQVARFDLVAFLDQPFG